MTYQQVVKKKKNSELTIFHEIHQYAKDHFPIFSSLVVIIFTVLIWTIRTLWYSYQIGMLSVYKIDKAYIDASSDNVMFQIIQLLAVIVIWFFINFIIYYLLTTVNKRKINILFIVLIVLLESFGLVMIITLQIYKSVGILFKVIQNSTSYDIFLLIILLLVTCFTINMFGIVFALVNYFNRKREQRVDKKEKIESKNELPKTSEKKENIYKTCKIVIITFILTISIEMGLMYYAGVQTEITRTDYKVIISESQSNIINSEKYKFQLGNMINNVNLFPIIYENQNVYIVSLLYKENNKIKFNYDYQKIIKKNDIETFYMINIKDLIQK